MGKGCCGSGQPSGRARGGYFDQFVELMYQGKKEKEIADRQAIKYAHIPNNPSRYTGNNNDGDYATRRGVDQQRGPIVGSVFENPLYH